MATPLSATFARWGEPPEPVVISPRARAFLDREVGPATPRPAVPVADIVLPEGRLPAAAAAALAAAVGPAHLRTDREARLTCAGGASYVDLLRKRAGDVSDAPDAVVEPASHDEVMAVLRVCAEHRVAVVPFGGGTSVVGGVRPLRDGCDAVVALWLHRMADLVHLDVVSGLATVGPGITGPVLERLLAARGFTLGHLPQSWERGSVGGYVATRSAGQSSSGYGRADEMVDAVRVATPSGDLRLGRAPSSAAGPKLTELFVGSEGVLGVLTEVTLRVRHLPGERRYEGLMFPSYAAGIAGFRALAQAELRPDVMRLSDRPETEVTLAMSGPTGRVGSALDAYLRARHVAEGALAILGWEGVPGAVRARRAAAGPILRQYGAVSLGARVGRSWEHGRFSGPYLRDVLLDEGYLVETLETATHWDRLEALHDAVRSSLRGSLADDGPGPIVMSHVSHVYETGASLYLTVVARADRADPVGQWQEAKRAATQTIVDLGATVTHHHALGTDHAPWLPDEVGPLGVAVLRAVKDVVDPVGVLNPGKLLPPPAGPPTGS
jgi:alkyldihydroxyacetonephosphate synthase